MLEQKFLLIFILVVMRNWDVSETLNLMLHFESGNTWRWDKAISFL